MQKNRRWVLIAAIVTASTGLMMMNWSRAAEHGQRVQPEDFLNVGTHYVHTNHIDYIMNIPDGMLIVFEGQGQLKLTGVEAAALRKWLDGRSNSLPLTPGTGNGISYPNPSGSEPMPG